MSITIPYWLITVFGSITIIALVYFALIGFYLFME